MQRRGGSAGESAVTPIIGTILVLAITVAGISVALLLGTPVLQRLQDQAALEAMVGQFQEVRHAVNSMSVPETSRNPGLSLPGGVATLGAGSHVMVQESRDDAPACDFRISNWADFDDKLTILGSCPVITPVIPLLGCAPAPGATACLLIDEYQGGTGQALGGSYVAAGSFVDMAQNLREDRDYRFRLVGNASAGGATYAEAWLLHSDQLSWAQRDVSTHYELGAIFAFEDEVAYLVNHPAVTEPDEDSASYFLRFPTLQDSEGGSFTGDGSHAISLTLDGIHSRATALDVTTLRLDFHGDLAEAWCNGFLLRDALGPPYDGGYDPHIGLATDTSCTADPGIGLDASDDTYGVKFTPDPDVFTTFSFDLAQPILDARLQI